MSRHHAAGVTGPRWRRLRLQVFEAAGYRCRKCGGAGRLECDHIRPLHRGGDPWAMDNLQALCRGCHIAKTRAERLARQETPLRRAWRALVEELAS